MGARPETYIPHRIDEGYGLNVRAVERIAAGGHAGSWSRSTAASPASRRSPAPERLGLDVVIVDHHTVPETLPAATAVLNPHQPGCEYPTRDLCAAGVAFNLVMALRRSLRTLGLVRAATRARAQAAHGPRWPWPPSADVVPLAGANRVLVRHGLEALGKRRAARRPGAQGSRRDSRPRARSAPGRWASASGPASTPPADSTMPRVGLQLLRTRNLDRGAPARCKARRREPATGRKIERKMLVERPSPRPRSGRVARGLVLWSEGWHPGVVGIVAARVVERFHKPTVVIGVQGGVGKGSARSVEGFHLVEALGDCAEHLSKFGGHRHAAGVTLEAERLLDFRRAFEQPSPPSDSARRTSSPAAGWTWWWTPAELTERAVRRPRALGSLRRGEPRAHLRRRVAPCRRPAHHREERRRAHLKLVLPASPALDTIGFGMGPRLLELEGPVDLAFQPSVDTWNGADPRLAQAARLSLGERGALRHRFLRPAAPSCASAGP